MIRLSFDIFGYHIAGFTLDLTCLPEEKPRATTKATSMAVKGISRLWVKGMTL